MESLIQDVRYAFRSLANAPGFTLVTLITLALGIGANSAIFTVVNGVLLRPLPYGNPGQLVVVRETYSGGAVGTVSGPNFLDWRERNHQFDGMTASRGITVSLVGAGEPEEIGAALVSAEFFQVLGVAPILGRGFLPREEQGEAMVAVIGEGLWRTSFGADPGILGRSISLSGRPYAVVGVAPKNLAYPGRSQLWLPLGFGTGQAAERSSHSYDVIGRLKPGSTVEQGHADLAAIARDLERDFPATNTGRSVVAIPLTFDTVGGIRPALLLISGAVAFVLLIACANVANLFLARAVRRQREIAVRAALGAGRWRLIRQVLVEAIVLAAAGGLLGLLLASWAVDLLLSLQPAGIPRLRDVAIDGSVLGFTLVVSLVVGIVFSLVPALTLSAQDPAGCFRGEGRGASAGRSRTRFRASLVVAQVSLALMLLAGATLLLVSVRRLSRVDPGFRPEGATTFQLTLATAKYPDAEAQRGFVARVLGQLQTVPGVRSAGAVFYLPLGAGDVNGDVSIEGSAPAAPGHELFAGLRMVAGDYFGAMGLTRKRGRLLGPEDASGAPRVAVVNETLARKYLPGTDPIGQRITLGSSTDSPEWLRIVGVVADVRHADLATDPNPELYLPIPQLSSSFWGIFTPIPISFVVRSDDGLATLTPAIKAAVHEVDPEQPISRLREAGELITDSVARQRFSMQLLVLFGLLALTLASVGLYGVMAYSVSQRTRELGIRLALGARASSVRALVLRQGLGMTLIGIGLGLLGAAAVSRTLTGLLYDVSPGDPRVLGAVALLLLLVAALACLGPALRATRVDPIEALRSE